MRESPTARALAAFLPEFVQRKLDAGFAFRLVGLWRNWAEVVGPEVAELARPLGHRKRILLVGAEDSLALQEVGYYSPEILERVNAFLGEESFDKVQADLLLGRAPLDTVGVAPPVHRMGLPPRPAELGGLGRLKQDDSAIGRCYRAYVRLFGEQGTDGR